MSFWDTLRGRSPKDAANPNVQPVSTAIPGPPLGGGPIELVERNLDVHSTAGLHGTQRRVDSLYRGAHGEIIRHREDCQSMLFGCGHAKAQDESDATRKLGGICVFCVREYQLLVHKGAMDPLEAERLSLVCRDCAEVSVSGYLCCPRHRTQVVGPNGKTLYIDPETAKNMTRQETVSKALNAILWLFGKTQDPRVANAAQEHGHE